jgi:hypothetical protein
MFRFLGLARSVADLLTGKTITLFGKLSEDCMFEPWETQPIVQRVFAQMFFGRRTLEEAVLDAGLHVFHHPITDGWDISLRPLLDAMTEMRMATRSGGKIGSGIVSIPGALAKHVRSCVEPEIGSQSRNTNASGPTPIPAHPERQLS